MFLGKWMIGLMNDDRLREVWRPIFMDHNARAYRSPTIQEILWEGFTYLSKSIRHYLNAEELISVVVEVLAS